MRLVGPTRIAAYRALARFSAAGLIGLVCMVTTIVLALSLVIADGLQLRRQLRDLRTEYRLASSKVDRAQMQQPDTPGREEGVLPSIRDVPEVMGELISAAAEQGFVVSSADYHWSGGSEVSPAEYEVRIGLKGSYLPARRFARQLLLQEPALALRELTFARQGPADLDLDIKADFVLFLNPNSQ